MFKETILILEDDPGTVFLEKRCLEAVGYTVLTAIHTDEAKKMLEQGGIALLLLDYRLPGGKNGLDFFKNLQKDGFSLPVIMVTGFASEAAIIEALSAGVSDFITKSKAYFNYLPEAVNRIMVQLHTRQALVKSETRFSGIIQTSMDAIIMLDVDGNIILFNPSAEQMFSITETEALGQPGTHFLSVTSSLGMADKITVTSVNRFETFGHRVNGKEFPVEVSLAKMMPDGTSILIVREKRE